MTNEERELIVAEYMSEPENQIKAMLSSVISLGMTQVSTKEILSMLANYTGMVLAIATHGEAPEDAEEIIDSFADRMKELLSATKSNLPKDEMQ